MQHRSEVAHENVISWANMLPRRQAIKEKRSKKKGGQDEIVL